MNAILKDLEQRAGIHFMGVNADLQIENASIRFHNNGLACDAQPTLITQSSSGIPAFLSTFIDPKLIEVLVAPMKAVEVAGEEIKKGDWLTETALFPVVESTGIVSSYGDYSQSGVSGANFNFPQRQSYQYQVITQWGERELEKAGLAKIDLANRINIASVLTLNKFQNKSYFYGVAGLQNYGLLNDPQLPAVITPATKAAGGTGWTNATAQEVYADVQAMYTQAQTQSNGLLELDTPFTLAMSPTSEVALTKVSTNFYGVSVKEVLAKAFPKMKFITAPEYATASGNLVQLIVQDFEGQRTVDCAFTEKLRAHPVFVDLSSFRQKKSQGTWGSVVYRPVFITGMLGV